jgi:hypothetical protein
MSQLGCIANFPQPSIVGHVRTNEQLHSDGLQSAHGKCQLNQSLHLSPDRHPLIGDHVERIEHQNISFPVYPLSSATSHGQ